MWLFGVVAYWFLALLVHYVFPSWLPGLGPLPVFSFASAVLKSPYLVFAVVVLALVSAALPETLGCVRLHRGRRFQKTIVSKQ